ncbi:MAG: hypothetical protein ACE5DS_04755 [Kiloniellaceae bacterium]
MKALRRWSFVPAVLVSLVVAACTGGPPPPPCPTVVSVKGADSLVRFNGLGRDLTDVVFEAKLEGADIVCDYDDNVVEAEMRVGILAVHGPADKERMARFTYFVAVATRERKVLAREAFDMEIPFPGNRTRIMATDQITQRIPLKPGESGADYVVYVGLALTPEELRYNLDNR